MHTRQSLRHAYKRRRTNPPPTHNLTLARKKLRRTPPPPPACDHFDVLPDDLVTSILIKLVASAAAPSDLLSITMTCKRMNELAFHPVVLSRASARSLAVKAKHWSDSTHRFLKRFADAGSHEALYILGMIRFYCLNNRRSGASLMAKAAIASHAAALYSLAVIQFNGSGGAKTDKDLRAGVALCARAAYLGHIDALRELGHCLQDGYGVRQNVNEGRRFLVQANARELAAVLGKGSPGWLAVQSQAAAAGCPLLSDFGWSVPEPDPHPANQFLLEWFREKGAETGLRLCSHAGCGRPETRKHEFRRCSVCGTVNYCSRACQALDWKVTHKAECAPFDIWNFEDGVGGAAVAPAPAPAEEDGRTD